MKKTILKLLKMKAIFWIIFCLPINIYCQNILVNTTEYRNEICGCYMNDNTCVIIDSSLYFEEMLFKPLKNDYYYEFGKVNLLDTNTFMIECLPLLPFSIDVVPDTTNHVYDKKYAYFDIKSDVWDSCQYQKYVVMIVGNKEY